MFQGYFKLWRIIFEKPIWLNSTPQQKSVLITLISMANYQENEWEWKGAKFKVMPGQFVTSLESIRARAGLGISIQNVRSSLKRFKKLQFLTYKSTKMGRVITIINWDSYQSNENGDQQSTQQRGNKGATPIEESKKVKKKTYAQSFDLFWETYPKKMAKMDAAKAWEAHKCNLIADKIMESVKAHINSKPWKKDEGEFIPHPTTFLNQHRWDDEVEMPKITRQSTMKSGRSIVEQWKKEAEGGK